MCVYRDNTNRNRIDWPRQLKGALLLLVRKRPDSVFQDVRFAIRGVLRQPGFTSAVVALLAVAIFLAALGLYGVLAYSVSRRNFEIGVRIALGAAPRDVFVLVLKRGLILVAAGIALGLVGAFWASRLLQQILFDIAPTGAATFVTVSLVFALVGLIACLIPARKALRVNPVNALAVQ